MWIKSGKQNKFLKNKKTKMRFSSCPRDQSTEKNRFLGQKLCPVARSQTHTDTQSDYGWHPIRVSDICLLTYHQGSVHNKTATTLPAQKPRGKLGNFRSSRSNYKELPKRGSPFRRVPFNLSSERSSKEVRMLWHLWFDDWYINTNELPWTVHSMYNHVMWFNTPREKYFYNKLWLIV